MDFSFILPRKIIFGQRPIAQIGVESARLGGEKAVVVTSQGMQKWEPLKQLSDSFRERRLNFEIFASVEPEPSIQSASDCALFAGRNRCDLVIGLGGGSAIDVAKKVAADSGLPGIMVPTTAGTGSEVIHESVFKVDGKKKAFVEENLVPDVAIVDPELTRTMPPSLAASSGIDALAHALECYESKKSNPMVRTLALQAFNLIKENIQEAIEGLEGARINMSLGSLMSGMAFGNSGTTLAHALSYPFSNRGVPHSEAVAMVLPYAMEFNSSDSAFLEEVRKIVKIVKPRWDSDWDIEKMAEEVMGDEKHLSNNPREVVFDNVFKMLQGIKEELQQRRLA